MPLAITPTARCRIQKQWGTANSRPIPACKPTRKVTPRQFGKNRGTWPRSTKKLIKMSNPVPIPAYRPILQLPPSAAPSHRRYPPTPAHPATNTAEPATPQTQRAIRISKPRSSKDFHPRLDRCPRPPQPPSSAPSTTLRGIPEVQPTTDLPKIPRTPAIGKFTFAR